LSMVYFWLYHRCCFVAENGDSQPTLSRNRTLSHNLRESVWGAHTLSRKFRESVPCEKVWAKT
jgi:hypothetical protein